MKAPVSAAGCWAMSSVAASCCIWSTLPANTREAYKTCDRADAYEGHLAEKIEIVAYEKIDAVTRMN